MGYIRLERVLPKNQHTQRNFLNFENWTNGEPRVTSLEQLSLAEFSGE